MFNRKVKKLIRDPKLFFSDMIKKRTDISKKPEEKIKNGNYEYTIVSAVYNVGRYLEEYFKSLVTQKLDFKNNLHVILIDDGSTDDSASIIKKWIRKYPENITYIAKDNGGQASARNLGLQHVKTEWVTFIDPDDFVDSNYFSSIDKFAKKYEQQDLNLISCNFIFFFDDLNVFKDTHPLKYRFAKGDQLVPINDMGKHVQLSVNSAIFRISKIRENDIIFDTEIKPNYEDAEFVTKYIFPLKTGKTAFLKSAKYYYRKRSDGTSTLDSAWEKPGLYDIVLQKGCINSMQNYLDAGLPIPESLQIKVLYHIFWYLKRFINNRSRLSFLTDMQILKFEELVHEIFSMIDDKVILQFSLAGCWFYHKVGMLASFKNTDPSFQIVYVEAYDNIKQLVQLRYFTKDVNLEHITIDGADTLPSFAKTIKHDFLGKNFVNERRLWVKIKPDSLVNIQIADITTNLSLAAKQEKNGIRGSKIISHFRAMTPTYPVNDKYKNAWVLMDRDNHADDNAEHLYNYIQKTKPEIKIYFALRKDSQDWERLQKNNFNLLEFGSSEHSLALQNCSKVISSHADYCVTNLLGPKMLYNRHFVFLQHGITKDDLSGWLNQKDNIDCFVTASLPEYNSIISDSSRYKYGKKEVVLTGFPRHDSLLASNHDENKTILIMPTWRSSIVGEPNKNGSMRDLNPDFIESSYFNHWYNILHSQKLADIYNSFGYNIIFSPHLNIIPYLELFNIPSYIDINSNRKIQEVFSSASLLITDYSSVAFDMAVQSKPTIYYQFDEEEVFNGTHTYSKGYFDYRKDGFGPVVTNQKEFFESLEAMLMNNAKTTDEIQNRIDSTLTLRDGRSCERVLEAIQLLDKPLDPDFIDRDILLEYAQKAYLNDRWDIAVNRWEKVFHKGHESTRKLSELAILQSLNNSGRIADALIYLSTFNDNNYWDEPVLRELATIQMKLHKWDSAKNYWNKVDKKDDEAIVKLLQCYAEQNDIDGFVSELSEIDYPLNDNAVTLIDSWRLVCVKEWDSAKSLILEKIENLELDHFYSSQSYIILSRCEKFLGHYSSSKKYLELAEKASSKHLNLEFDFASISFLKNDWKETINLFQKNKIKLTDLPDHLITIYLNSLRSFNKVNEALSMINNLDIKTNYSSELSLEIAETHYAAGNWEHSIKEWIKLINTYDIDKYRFAHAYRMVGKIEDAIELIIDVKSAPPRSIDNWILRAELCQLCSNWDEACHSWLSILRHYPEEAPKESWSRLNNVQLMKLVTEMKS